jgi:2'-5' RNA ligase
MVKDVIDDVRLNIEGDYDDVSDRIEMKISSEPIEVEIDGIDIFENKDFDVVKFNVKKSYILQELHDELSTIPNSNKFKDFTPHITIAYVKRNR